MACEQWGRGEQPLTEAPSVSSLSITPASPPGLEEPFRQRSCNCTCSSSVSSCAAGQRLWQSAARALWCPSQENEGCHQFLSWVCACLPPWESALHSLGLGLVPARGLSSFTTSGVMLVFGYEALGQNMIWLFCPAPRCPSADLSCTKLHQPHLPREGSLDPGLLHEPGCSHNL